MINDEFFYPFLAQMIFRIAMLLFQPIIDGETYYLPADRTGIMHSHQVLVSTLIQNSARAGIDPSHVIPVLSGVLADFLDQLISIGRNRRGFSSKSKVRRDAAHEIAEKMERDILHGDVQLNRSDAGYPLFDYKPDGWREEIPLMRSSSMVSELAPVVLYLRHLVNPGDVLIIEEPESHLHPKMQASFAIQLSLLVRSGIRVIVTTHSEWLLEQFANLVRLSNLPESKREGIPGSLAALRPDEFGAWSFEENDRPKGSIVKEIKVDFEAGGLLTDFDDTADDLYNTWAEIGNRIIMKDDRVDQN